MMSDITQIEQQLSFAEQLLDQGSIHESYLACEEVKQQIERLKERRFRKHNLIVAMANRCLEVQRKLNIQMIGCIKRNDQNILIVSKAIK